MNSIFNMLMFLMALSFIQNIVLSTGFGCSVLIRIVRRPKDIFLFSAFLAGFSLLTILIAYPLDAWIGTGYFYKLFRPFMLIIIAAVLYVTAIIILKKWAPSIYQRVSRLLPLAAFNNVVIGLALIVNHQFAVTLLEAIGLSIGSCIGFMLLSCLTAEAMEHFDNPDTPAAFRGIPAMLVYLGILALGLMGFSGGFSLL